MKLYIIGNGFDLNNKFQTQFEQYKKFFETYDFDSIYREFDKDANNFPYTMFKENFKRDKKWTDVEDCLKFDYQNYFEDYCSLYNQPRYSPDKKVDHSLINFFNNIYFFVGKCYYEWLSKSYYNRLSSIKQIPENLEFLKNNKEDIFLTFNYTPTLEDVYNISSDKILHIHGCLNDVNEEDINLENSLCDGRVVHEIRNAVVRKLQFGSVDNNPYIVKEALNKINIDSNNDMFSQKKVVDDIINFCRWTYKDTKSNYKKLSNFIKDKNIDEVIIMGHSVMGVDLLYYDEIIVPSLPNCKWKLYYHTREDEEMLCKFVEKFKIKSEIHELKNW